jgi:hypothetical protein
LAGSVPVHGVSPFAAVGWQCQAQLGLAGRGSVGGAAEACSDRARRRVLEKKCERSDLSTVGNTASPLLLRHAGTPPTRFARARRAATLKHPSRRLHACTRHTASRYKKRAYKLRMLGKDRAQQKPHIAVLTDLLVK